MSQIIIYGATGYMGQLFAKELLMRGVKPILAGRSESVRVVAKEMDCQARVFTLENKTMIVNALEDAALLVNLAGPFDRTQPPLIKACLATGCHYLDIAGEVNEMRSAFAFDDQAKQAGIMLMPGAGFGVVPTDIAASMASEKFSGASTLKIFYATEGGVSRGTLKTVLKDINTPGVRRMGSELVTAHPAESTMDFAVAGQTFKAVYNPWRADLFTAGLSTGIDTIETYSVFPGFIVQMMKGRLLWLRDLLLKRLLRFLPEGPSDKQLQQGSTYVMAIASNGKKEASVALKGPEAYLFTAHCLIEIVQRVLDEKWAHGFQTPSFYGKGLLDDIDGVEWDRV